MELSRIGPSRYRVMRREKHERGYNMDTEVGTVRKVEVFRNPWSDKPPSIQWGAYDLNGSLVGRARTLNEAAALLDRKG